MKKKFDYLTTFYMHKSTDSIFNDAEHRLYQGVLDFQNSFKVSQCSYEHYFVYAPRLQYGFHCNTFQGKKNSSIHLRRYLMYRILSKSNYVENRRKFPL